jgi:hypothetical protein
MILICMMCDLLAEKAFRQMRRRTSARRRRATRALLH